MGWFPVYSVCGRYNDDASATSPVYLNDMILRIPHSSGMNVLWNAVDTCYIIACEYI